MLKRLKVASIASSYRHYVAAYLCRPGSFPPKRGIGLSEYEILKQTQAKWNASLWPFLGVSFFELSKTSQQMSLLNPSEATAIVTSYLF
jgi:hypothetical protein